MVPPFSGVASVVCLRAVVCVCAVAGFPAIMTSCCFWPTQSQEFLLQMVTLLLLAAGVAAVAGVHTFGTVPGCADAFAVAGVAGIACVPIPKYPYLSIGFSEN